ncbi:MAG: elongation factor G [Nitrospirae bacterium]|nr:MAG: elongation factor G [Nitrospirota bacterium]
MTQAMIDSLRNVVLASYPGAGKTSVAEALVYTAGVIPSMGSVSQGNTVSDFEPEEIQHHYSINTAVLHYEWKGTTFNLLDTPGSLNFLADTKSALHAGDGVVLVIGASDIRSELDRIWDDVRERHLPAVVFVNELDKERADFRAILEDLEKFLEIPCVPVTLPVGREADLRGVVDLVAGRMVLPIPDSPKVREEDIPQDMRSEAEEARKRLMECAAETDDQFVETYLTEGELSIEHIREGLAQGTQNRTFLPVVCGSAVRRIGMTVLHEVMTQCLPSPIQRAQRFPARGLNPQSGEEVIRHPSLEDPFSAFVFKTTIDPFMGRLTYIRVYSGALDADSAFYNSTRNTKEKGGHLYHLLGKKYTQVDRVVAGDIVAIGKLKDTQTGDTICTDRHPIQFPKVLLPRPVMSFALELKSKGDIDKVSLGMHKLVEEDPSLEFIRNDETKEMLLSGVGQTHIEITLEKLKRKYGVEVNLQTPKVAYRETIQKMAQAQGKYKKQTGGHGQYGDCWLQLDPLPRGEGFVFVNKIVGGVIPRNFIPAVEKGVVEAMQEGVLAGYPVVDVQVTVYDGSHHPVDSSELAFKVAASMGFKKAMEAAQPILLEPIMKVEVTAPDELVGAVIGDLNSRRGRILGMDAKGHNQVVKALVPLAEILKYAPALTSLTAGKGSYTMEFAGYEPAPREVTTRVIEEQRHAKQAVS